MENTLTPTSDPRIFESQWFVDPKHPLIENKIFYAKVDSIMYYITAHRGPTTDDISVSPDEVSSVQVVDTVGYEDSSRDCFNKLVKAISKSK